MAWRSSQNKPSGFIQAISAPERARATNYLEGKPTLVTDSRESLVKRGDCLDIPADGAAQDPINRTSGDFGLPKINEGDLLTAIFKYL